MCCHGGVQVSPEPGRICVQACALGEIARGGGTTCQRCERRLLSLWTDPRAPPPSSYQGAITSAASCSNPAYPPGSIPSSELPTCEVCPDNAECSGGAVVVPEAGFWHSSPNSTVMHACITPKACRALKDRARAEALQSGLLACQEAWYATPLPGQQVLDVLRRSGLLAAIEAGWVNQYGALKLPDDAVSFNSSILNGFYTNATSLLKLSSNASAGAMQYNGNVSVGCLLWGLPDDHPNAYMQAQCVYPYTGKLCAACRPGYTLSAEFQCK